MSSTSDAAPTDYIEITEVHGIRHWGRWIASAVLLVLAAMVLHMLVTNQRFQWDIVRHYFTSRSILSGLGMTLVLTVGAMLIGTVVGVALALMRLSTNRVMTGFSGGYVWFFRGTPVLVQILLLYNISALYPKLSLGIPFGPEFVTGNVNSIVTPLLAALVALGLNEAAFMCEIIKAGMLSVDRGQVEAAQVLGMTRRRLMRRIVLPQAMRFIVPPSANQVISMLKNTSIVSVIALSELLYSAQLIYTRDFTTIPLLIVASLWYLVITSILTQVQRLIERHYARSNRATRGPQTMRMLRFNRPGRLPKEAA
jgi:polar amino acid transport system permease protein